MESEGKNIPGREASVCKGPKARGSWASFKTERKPVWLSSVVGGLADARSHREGEGRVRVVGDMVCVMGDFWQESDLGHMGGIQFVF